MPKAQRRAFTEGPTGAVWERRADRIRSHNAGGGAHQSKRWHVWAATASAARSRATLATSSALSRLFTPTLYTTKWSHTSRRAGRMRCRLHAHNFGPLPCGYFL